jgi:hypothetical protein
LTKKKGAAENIAKAGRVKLPSVNKFADKLCLDKGVAPLHLPAGRPNPSLKQGMDGGLETGIVTAISAVIVAAVGVLTLGAG